jgi:hypothetical protein
LEDWRPIETASRDGTRIAGVCYSAVLPKDLFSLSFSGILLESMERDSGRGLGPTIIIAPGGSNAVPSAKRDMVPHTLLQIHSNSGSVPKRQ